MREALSYHRQFGFLATACLLTVSLIACLTNAQADADGSAEQGIQVEAFLNLTRMSFDDTLTLTLRLNWDKSLFELQERVSPQLDLQRLRVGSVTSKTGLLADKHLSDAQNFTDKNFAAKNWISQEYVYTLFPTASGDGAVNPVKVRFLRKSDAKIGSVSTPELQVAISMPVHDEQKSGTLWRDWRVIVVAGVVLLAVLGVGIALYQRKRRRLARDSQVRREWDRLADGLAELKRSTSGSKAEFFDALYGYLYTLLSDVGYVSSRKGDSDAVIAELKQAPVAEETKRLLIKWLERSAREKFSPGRGTPGETLRVYYEVEAFMRESWRADDRQERPL